jgi:RNA methyltransferase, TrmH family
MPELITSLQNDMLKRVRALEQKKARVSEGVFVAEGEGQLLRAREHGWQAELLVSTSDWATDTGLVRWVLDQGGRHISIPSTLMPRLTGVDNPPPVLAVIKSRELAAVKPEGIWLALEEIRDPGNLGTILRTAEAAGAAGVVLVGETCDPFSRECVRAATGSLFAMPMLRQSRQVFLDMVRDWPGDVIGTRMNADADYRDVMKRPAMIVMGSESKGMSVEVSKACTRLVSIPMAQGVESLNVAIASALMLYAQAGNQLTYLPKHSRS